MSPRSAVRVTQPSAVSQPSTVSQPSLVTQPSLLSQPGLVSQPSMVSQPGIIRVPTTALPQLSPQRLTTPRITIPSEIPKARSSIVGLGVTRPVSPSLPVQIPEVMPEGFTVKNYQGLIENSGLEKELLSAGYATLSRVVVRGQNGERKTQYIKAINKMGQTVFIEVDVAGYTSARATDLTLIQSHRATAIPYSVKVGASECAGMDVCGVAFECGSDNICVLSRGSDDLTPKEVNFVYVEQPTTSAVAIESDGSITTYPVVRLSEIRANPDLVLKNSDIVTRRLRNTTYTSELAEFQDLEKSAARLMASISAFKSAQGESTAKLVSTLSQLEKINVQYIKDPPVSDENKEKFRLTQFNLRHRNDDLTLLLRLIKRVADAHLEIEAVIKEINDLTALAHEKFARADEVLTP